MTLREFGKQDYLDGISYQGGVDDPAVWSHFEAQGRLCSDFENLDIGQTKGGISVSICESKCVILWALREDRCLHED